MFLFRFFLYSVSKVIQINCAASPFIELEDLFYFSFFFLVNRKVGRWKAWFQAEVSLEETVFLIVSLKKQVMCHNRKARADYHFNQKTVKVGGLALPQVLPQEATEGVIFCVAESISWPRAGQK